MKTAYVTFSAEIPDHVSFRDAYDFFCMEIKGEGGIGSENPLFEYDLQSLNIKSISLR